MDIGFPRWGSRRVCFEHVDFEVLLGYHNDFPRRHFEAQVRLLS